MAVFPSIVRFEPALVLDTGLFVPRRLACCFFVVLYLVFMSMSFFASLPLRLVVAWEIPHVRRRGVPCLLSVSFRLHLFFFHRGLDGLPFFAGWHCCLSEHTGQSLHAPSLLPVNRAVRHTFVFCFFFSFLFLLNFSLLDRYIPSASLFFHRPRAVSSTLFLNHLQSSDLLKASSSRFVYIYLPGWSGLRQRCAMVGFWWFDDVLALAKDVVGVTRGNSCVAAMVLQSLRWMRGHATTVYHAGHGCYWGCVVGFSPEIDWWVDEGRVLLSNDAWEAYLSESDWSRLLLETRFAKIKKQRFVRECAQQTSKHSRPE
jgi:hypothetical protein